LGERRGSVVEHKRTERGGESAVARVHSVGKKKGLHIQVLVQMGRTRREEKTAREVSKGGGFYLLNFFVDGKQEKGGNPLL